MPYTQLVVVPALDLVPEELDLGDRLEFLTKMNSQMSKLQAWSALFEASVNSINAMGAELEATQLTDESAIQDLQNTTVTLAGDQTITGKKTFTKDTFIDSSTTHSQLIQKAPTGSWPKQLFYINDVLTGFFWSRDSYVRLSFIMPDGVTSTHLDLKEEWASFNRQVLGVDATSSQGLVTKYQMDNADALKLDKTGGTVSGNLTVQPMSGNAYFTLRSTSSNTPYIVLRDDSTEHGRLQSTASGVVLKRTGVSGGTDTTLSVTSSNVAFNKEVRGVDSSNTAGFMTRAYIDGQIDLLSGSIDLPALQALKDEADAVIASFAGNPSIAAVTGLQAELDKPIKPYDPNYSQPAGTNVISLETGDLWEFVTGGTWTIAPEHADNATQLHFKRPAGYRPLPIHNRVERSGRFCDASEAGEVSITTWSAGSFTGLNGTVLAEGDKFHTNNTNFGGSAETLSPIVSALVDIPGGKRYGPEWYTSEVTQGVLTTSGTLSISGTDYNTSLAFDDSRILSSNKSHVVGMYIYCASANTVAVDIRSTTIIDGVLATTDTALSSGAHWITWFFNSGATTGYTSSYPIYAVPSAVFHIALPVNAYYNSPIIAPWDGPITE